MVRVDRCSVAQDDYGDWWLEFYVDDIRHAVRVSDVAAQQRVQPTGCWACGGEGIIRADGIAINCPECNPATSG